MTHEGIQAKDIKTEDFINAIRKVLTFSPSPAGWTNRGAVTEILAVNEKVVLAKFRKLEKQGLLGGCGCGCRGDWYERALP